MQESQGTWVRSLSREDPLEEGMATHSSILAWKIPMDRGAWRVIVHGVAKESDTTEPLSTAQEKIDVCNNTDITGKFTLWGLS